LGMASLTCRVLRKARMRNEWKGRGQDP
jgi:hypothetical protein